MSDENRTERKVGNCTAGDHSDGIQTGLNMQWEGSMYGNDTSTCQTDLEKVHIEPNCFD